MFTTKLTEKDKEFILANIDKLQVRQMHVQLKVHADAIRAFIKQQGLKTLYQQQHQPKTKPLSIVQKAYIRSHCKYMTVSKLARAIDNTNHAVAYYLKSKGLEAKRHHQYDKPQQAVQQYDVVKQKFERPPAVYSNPQWNY
jgi:hypothetical protein